MTDHPGTGTTTLAPLLRARVATDPDRPLLICDADRLTYSEAERRSAELARGLLALGAGKGTHVGLLHPNGADFVVGALAAARIGAVVVPFSTFSTARELREQLVHSDTHILLAIDRFRSHDYVQRLSEVLAGGERDRYGRVFCPAVPQLRRVAVDGEPGSHGIESVRRAAARLLRPPRTRLRHRDRRPRHRRARSGGRDR